MIDATALPPFSLHEKLGIEIIRVSTAEVIGSMSVTGNIQPAGLLHGGTTTVLVEGLASSTAWLHTRPERVAVDVNLDLTHLRPVVLDRVIGRAVPVHLENGITVRTVEVHDEERRLTTVGHLTSRLMAPRE